MLLKNFHIPNVKAMRCKCAIYISLIPMDILHYMAFLLNYARAIKLRWSGRTARMVGHRSGGRAAARCGCRILCADFAETDSSRAPGKRDRTAAAHQAIAGGNRPSASNTLSTTASGRDGRPKGASANVEHPFDKPCCRCEPQSRGATCRSQASRNDTCDKCPLRRSCRQDSVGRIAFLRSAGHIPEGVPLCG